MEIAEVQISNMETWAEMNGCSGSTPDIEIFEYDYSIIGYAQCENNASVQLFTLNLDIIIRTKGLSKQQPMVASNLWWKPYRY